ncbi:ABC transporter permease [Ensifer sp. ENS10]|jgi:spermidine/putrescine transport system permease protein|uniref:ABC transporter permease n=1 Tax=unclassified Ensifer TaxID=2633371 RepID=UPI00070EA6E9|nr:MULTISPECIES: ABC transporter permease [unclassified Ensifer]KRD49495.1 ABC transporter permease [Ensifer sp. Root278]MBD9510765.1 ABC transporter permease [Ensifer sp. ENS10]MBV7517968.1 ABC transporter permease [Ensifer sp. ENS12]
MTSANDLTTKLEAVDARRRWLLASPALLTIFLAAIGPLFIVLAYSFLTPGDYGDVKWQFSPDAWIGVFFERDIFDDTLSLATAHVDIFWRSVKLALITTVATLFFGFPTAYFMATRNERSRDLWQFLITIPFWTNLLIRTLAILQIIRNEGILNTALIKLGMIQEPIQILFTDTAILIGMVYVYLPLMVLPIYASLERLDFRLVEAGYDLYATRWRVLRKIILPLAKPGIIAGSILVFIPAIGAFVSPSVLGGGKNMMFSNLIELQFGQGRNWPLGSALSITVMIIVMAALLVYVRNNSAKDERHA